MKHRDKLLGLIVFAIAFVIRCNLTSSATSTIDTSGLGYRSILLNKPW